MLQHLSQFSDIYFITIGDNAMQKGLIFAEYLRTKLPAISLDT